MKACEVDDKVMVDREMWSSKIKVADPIFEGQRQKGSSSTLLQ